MGLFVYSTNTDQAVLVDTLFDSFATDIYGNFTIMDNNRISLKVKTGNFLALKNVGAFDIFEGVFEIAILYSSIT